MSKAERGKGKTSPCICIVSAVAISLDCFAVSTVQNRCQFAVVTCCCASVITSFSVCGKISSGTINTFHPVKNRFYGIVCSCDIHHTHRHGTHKHEQCQQHCKGSFDGLHFGFYLRKNYFHRLPCKVRFVLFSIQIFPSNYNPFRMNGRFFGMNGVYYSVKEKCVAAKKPRTCKNTWLHCCHTIISQAKTMHESEPVFLPKEI